ncbi:hypothetical protein DBR23_02335 [Acidovorax sp. HMWF018]|uniref:hypothetical protein n=1 Tax=Acidovorax sp. HMWF018 TaxID=2056855 RepID=UPI000D331AAF|nr:hypothetical protein [Acidovorax sp. HMWF018]PTT42983.1 hypothetical protein DBR23_02335 [Acidovorax sp. HMWF018]
MTELTAEQRQQRCDWAREIWAGAPSDSRWTGLLGAVAALLQEEGLDLEAEDFLALFTRPEDHLNLLDTLFEEHARRKLLGEAP